MFKMLSYHLRRMTHHLSQGLMDAPQVHHAKIPYHNGLTKKYYSNEEENKHPE